MKRGILPLELKPGIRQFEVEIRDPGIIHGFIMSLRPKSVLAPLGIVGINEKAQQMEQIPVLLIEIDPDAGVRRRRFIVLALGEVYEAEKLIYRATVSTPNGNLFHLFEGPEVNSEEKVPVEASA